MNNILVNREYSVDGNWYAPAEYLKKFKSVEWVETINMTSSAGDWSGIFCQKIGDIRYIIPFGQENYAWRGGGWKLYTEDRYLFVTTCVSKDEIIEVVYKVFYEN